MTCADCITAASWATKVHARSAARWSRTTAGAEPASRCETRLWTLSGEACGGRVHMPTRCSSSGHTSRRKAAKRATRARRERARGAARSGAPEQWRPDQCTTRRASASVAGATTTDRWHRSNTLPPARAAQLHREAHRKLSEQTPGFERDERVEGKRTAASRVREEVCRHVDLPSPSVVILLATAAPRCGCGASIMVGT